MVTTVSEGSPSLFYLANGDSRFLQTISTYKYILNCFISYPRRCWSFCKHLCTLRLGLVCRSHCKIEQSRRSGSCFSLDILLLNSLLFSPQALDLQDKKNPFRQPLILVMVLVFHVVLWKRDNVLCLTSYLCKHLDTWSVSNWASYDWIYYICLYFLSCL
jgi:hypothetical protein